MLRPHSRRGFLRQSAAIAAGACTSLAFTGDVNGSSAARLKVGIVGSNGNGAALSQVVRECDAEVVAHCEAGDRARRELSAAGPRVVAFDDARSMIERAGLDAVVIAPGVAGGSEAARIAMQHGCHVWSGPLGESLSETRELGELARSSGVQTQVDLRTACDELVRHVVAPLQSGAIGRVREVVCWSNGRNPRGFQSQGHRVLSLPLSALGLRHPSSIFAAGSEPPGAGFPKGMAVRYAFPRRGGQHPLLVTWYDGAWAPPYESVDGIVLSECGALYLGESGQLLDDLGTGRATLLLEGESPRELGSTPAPSDLSVRQWLAACTGRQQTLTSLDCATILNETILAGLIAYRVQQPLEWDGRAMRARNCPAADALVRSSIDALAMA